MTWHLKDRELEKRLAPRMMNAEDFVLLPSE